MKAFPNFRTMIHLLNVKRNIYILICISVLTVLSACSVNTKGNAGNDGNGTGTTQNQT